VRKFLPERLEFGRVGSGDMASTSSNGAYGMFHVNGPCGEVLRIIASGADDNDTLSDGWEHVSVSTQWRIPNWLEMSFVKDLFWEPEECVVQFHPPHSEYVNNHALVLHLWRNKRTAFPMPPSILVGIKGVGELTRDEARAIKSALTQKEAQK
jgi:hypothetical protein